MGLLLGGIQRCRCKKHWALVKGGKGGVVGVSVCLCYEREGRCCVVCVVEKEEKKKKSFAYGCGVKSTTTLLHNMVM